MITRLKLLFDLQEPATHNNTLFASAKPLDGDDYEVMFTAKPGTALPVPGSDIELFYRHLVGHPHVLVSAHPPRHPVPSPRGYTDPITTVFVHTENITTEDRVQSIPAADYLHADKGTR